MKQVIILLITILFFISCENPKMTNKKTLIVVARPLDTIFIEAESDIPVLTISESKKKLIDSFRPPLRDIAYYMLLNEDKLKQDRYCFKCGEYEFWTANDYWAFELYKPYHLTLTNTEKQYFWKLYNNYRENKRLFKYENEIKIVLK